MGPSAPNVANRTLFEADNLPIMRGINSETIDLIATDPPFNKGKDFHATPDSLAAGAKFQDRWKWEDDVHPDWVETIQDQWPAAWAVIDWTRMAYGDDMGAFLCFIGVRLMEMHRILKPTGSLYLHCDDTASAYLTALMDAIFGRKNRRNVITWQRMRGSKNAANQMSRNSDTILWYARSEAVRYNTQYTPLAQSALDHYKHDDGDGRGLYRLDNINAPGEGGYFYDLGCREKPPGSGYRMPEATARQWLSEGLLVVREGRVPVRKRYLSDSKGTPLSNVWTDIPNVVAANKKESVGYPTQKPLALYDRIIRASSNEGDWVLDPFAGCATTPIAAELANRNWIAIDLWDGAINTTIERFQKTTGLAADGTAVNTMAIIGQLQHRTDAPQRTDGGDAAAPYLPTPTKGKNRKPLMGVSQMKDILVDKFWLHCWGCNFVAPDPRYLELDHIRPRNSGGSDDIDNRALLCGPCNKIKRDHATLVSLRQANEQSGHLSGIHPVNLKEAGRWTRRIYEEALAARLSA